MRDFCLAVLVLPYIFWRCSQSLASLSHSLRLKLVANAVASDVSLDYLWLEKWSLIILNLSIKSYINITKI